MVKDSFCLQRLRFSHSRQTWMFAAGLGGAALQMHKVHPPPNSKLKSSPIMSTSSASPLLSSLMPVVWLKSQRSVHSWHALRLCQTGHMCTSSRGEKGGGPLDLWKVSRISKWEFLVDGEGFFSGSGGFILTAELPWPLLSINPTHLAALELGEHTQSMSGRQKCVFMHGRPSSSVRGQNMVW